MALLHPLLLQQHFLSHHLLKDQFLIPSLLVSLRFPRASVEPTDQLRHNANNNRVWPTHNELDKHTQGFSDKFPNKEDLQMAITANQLAIAQLSQVVLYLLGPCHFLSNSSQRLVRSPPSLPEVADVLSAIQGLSVTQKPYSNIAQPGQFPWLVSVQLSNFYDASYHLCGGTLLAPDWVLTAAHCLDGENPAFLQVVAGELDMDVDEGTEQYIRVSHFIQHPQYTYWETPYENDLALVHLAEPVLVNDLVKVASLPSLTFLPDTEGDCREAGWGVSNEGAPGSRILIFVDVPLMPRHQCQAAYPALGQKDLCAGQGGAGSCVGDNGGALMCVTANGDTLTALMSWREGCARPGKPAVYMDVGKYISWISNVTGLVLRS
ncbi:trypsin-1 isoform X1 [Cherax quadricarinatus]